MASAVIGRLGVYANRSKFLGVGVAHRGVRRCAIDPWRLDRETYFSIIDVHVVLLRVEIVWWLD